MPLPRQFCPQQHDTHITGRYASYRCKECTKEDARVQYVAKVRPPLSSEELKMNRREYEYTWRKSNPEKVRGYARKYREKPKSKILASVTRRRWQQDNRVYLNQIHTARMRDIAPAQRKVVQEVMDYYGPNCVYCGKEASGLDHLRPVSKGGKTEFDNLAPACKSCNSTKWAHPIWVMVGREVICSRES